MASVLIVDDDDDSRLALRLFLEWEGHQVREAANGHEALVSLAESRPSLVLLDLMMPVLSGAEVLRILHDAGRVPDLPVVVVTADTRPTDIEGARLVLHKPLHPERLLPILRALADDGAAPTVGLGEEASGCHFQATATDGDAAHHGTSHAPAPAALGLAVPSVCPPVERAGISGTRLRKARDVREGAASEEPLARVQQRR